jgi:hypothetical protein
MIPLRHILLLTALALLCGCACGVRPRPSGGDGPSVAAELASLGVWFLWAGAIVVVLGVAARAYFASAPPIAAFAVLAAEIGAAAFAFGICSIWVADHPWLLPVTGVATALAFAFRYRNRIRRWLHLGPSPVPSNEDVKP